MSSESRRLKLAVRTVLVSVLILLAAPAVSLESPAWALSPSEIETAVDDALTQRHPNDTPSFWRGLGPEAPGVIISMYEKTDESYRKLRLLGALAWYQDSPRALEFLKREAENNPDQLIRDTAIKSVGISQDAKELEFVAKYLSHQDPQTRLAAAETLKGMHDPRARGRLDQYMKDEKASWIVARLKGESVIAPGSKLLAVSSSEDRVSPDFEGLWKGYYITTVEGTTALRSVPAVIRLSIEPSGALKGELILQVKAPGAAKGRPAVTQNPVFSFSKVSAKARRFTAEIPTEASLKKAPGAPLTVEAELTDLKLLLVRVPRTGGVLSLRRE